MNKSREQLIAELNADLAPVRGGQATRWLLPAWLAAAALVSLTALLVTGPLRAGSVAALVSAPQFLLESLTGVAAIAALAWAGVQLSVPSLRSPLALIAAPLLLLTAWIAFYVYGLVDPALVPGMTGKREGCWYETTLIGVPALVLGLVFARRLWPLHGARTGLVFGLAAGAVPALLMQFACMYIPQHILLHHVAPGLLLGPVGAVAGWIFLRPR